MLCFICRSIIQQLANELNSIATSYRSTHQCHHHSYQSLKTSVDNGCYICNRIWEALTTQERGLISTNQDHGSEAQVAHSAVTVQSSLTSASLGDGTQHGHPGCYFLQFAYNRAAVAKLPLSGTSYCKARLLLEPVTRQRASLTRRRLPQSTGSLETLSLAKHWIKECTKHHKQCIGRGNYSSWYPTRLLAFDLDKPSVVRLLETSQITPVGQYTTLTHRWGSPNQTILTKDTYPQLLKGLPLSSLPQVFQDAIFISRQIGVRNIWIDCLCIFQGLDNTSDWQREASLMRDVYSNSFCNISAADNADCSKSIFNNRRSDTLCPQVIELVTSGQGGRIDTLSFLLSDYTFWESEVSNALVNKRAWVLQERFLSPRILHFGRNQLVWECFEKDAAEVYPDRVPLALSKSSDTRFKQLDSQSYMDRVNRYKYRFDDGLSAPHLLWVRIVELYTACALTVPSDKLIACSGIAKKMREVIMDDYVAGMWRRYLEGELLWVVEGKQSPGRSSRPSEYRAPTWSWASIDGHIIPGEPRVKDSLIVVEAVHLDYWTSDTTAAIRGGWLCLRGVLRKTSLMRRDLTVDREYYWDMYLDGNKVTEPDKTSIGNSEPRVMLDILQEEFEEENSNGLLFSMCARSRNGDGNGMYILLLKMVQGQAGTFRRIGIAYAWTDRVKERVLGKTSVVATLPCLKYQDGVHSIRII